MLTGIDGGGTEIEGLTLGEKTGRGEDGDDGARVIEPIDKTQPFIGGMTNPRALRRLMRDPR